MAVVYVEDLVVARTYLIRQVFSDNSIVVTPVKADQVLPQENGDVHFLVLNKETRENEFTAIFTAGSFSSIIRAEEGYVIPAPPPFAYENGVAKIMIS